MDYIEYPTYKGTEIVVCQTEMEEPRARLASELLRVSIVACVPDGEDSSGKQKFRLMTPEETVERATTIASLAWNVYRDRGWILDVPLPKINKEIQH